MLSVKVEVKIVMLYIFFKDFWKGPSHPKMPMDLNSWVLWRLEGWMWPFQMDHRWICSLIQMDPKNPWMDYCYFRPFWGRLGAAERGVGPARVWHGRWASRGRGWSRGRVDQSRHLGCLPRWSYPWLIRNPAWIRPDKWASFRFCWECCSFQCWLL